jgi:hypothetical protein
MWSICLCRVEAIPGANQAKSTNLEILRRERLRNFLLQN